MSNLLRIDKLDMGMILEKDIVDPKTGVILIAKNMAITKSFIDKLISNGIDEVPIIKEEIPIEKYNEPLMEEYNKIADQINKVFNDVKNGEKLNAEEITTGIKGFVQEIIKERDILTQMRLLKRDDNYIFNHSLAVSALAASLGKWMNYSQKEILELSIVGLFHDIGKLKIDDEIINKPADLTEKEYEILRKHPFYGSQILSASGKFSEDIILGVLQHHEKIDGSGYPNKVTGDRIHKYARVVSICNVYHYLTSRRIYNDKESPLKVADYIRRGSFSFLDPHMTQVFLKNIATFYVGNKVVLSTGEIGIIVYIHPQDKTRPVVKVGDKFIDFLVEKDIEVVDIII